MLRGSGHLQIGQAAVVDDGFRFDCERARRSDQTSAPISINVEVLINSGGRSEFQRLLSNQRQLPARMQVGHQDDRRRMNKLEPEFAAGANQHSFGFTEILRRLSLRIYRRASLIRSRHS